MSTGNFGKIVTLYQQEMMPGYIFYPVSSKG